MTGLQRLWVCVVLQAIAEQDEKYVLTCQKARGDRAWRTKKAILARQARAFVASSEFEEICYRTGLDGQIWRQVSPDVAARAFMRLQRGDYAQPEDVFEPEPDESPPLEREPTAAELVALELEVEV
jgi:hypothetical protein